MHLIKCINYFKRKKIIMNKKKYYSIDFYRLLSDTILTVAFCELITYTELFNECQSILCDDQLTDDFFKFVLEDLQRAKYIERTAFFFDEYIATALGRQTL